MITTEPTPTFRERPVTRQRLWQIKLAAEGRCIICGIERPAPPEGFRADPLLCPSHREALRVGGLRRTRKKSKIPKDTAKIKSGRPTLYALPADYLK